MTAAALSNAGCARVATVKCDDVSLGARARLNTIEGIMKSKLAVKCLLAVVPYVVLTPLSAAADESSPTPTVSVPATIDSPARTPEAGLPGAAPVPSSVDTPHDDKKKEPFHEKGRFGFLGALTDDMWKAGLVFEHEHFEAQVLFHAGFETGDTRDLHFVFKAGGRIPLGALNYLAIGGEYGPHWASKDAGLATGGSFHVAPYVGLQRYFAGTPLMINLWVCPGSYEYFENNDGAGKLVSTKTAHVFRQGGFGLAYLF